MRKNVEPALRTVPPCRTSTAATRSGGDEGEPSSRTDTARQRSAAEIMYDCPVIHPGVATTHQVSEPGRTSRTRRDVAQRPTW